MGAVQRVIVVLTILGMSLTPCWALDLTQTVDFNIPAQNLDSALVEFSRQAKIQIVTAGAQLQKLSTEGAVGKFTISAALTKLLGKSGLSFKAVGESAISVVSFSAMGDRGALPPDLRNEAQVDQGSPAAVSAANPSQSSQAAIALQEVVVTAEKKNERLLDTPVPLSVIDAEQLTTNGQVLLRDYYMTVPGLTLQPDIVSQQNLFIRGIAGGGNPTVGVTLDDIPFRGSVESTGGGFLPDLDPSELDHVEVLRGPQGTLYGANSMGGLVKYVTKDPSTAALSARIEAGSSSVYNGAEPGFNIRGSVNIPLTDTFAVRISGFRRQDPGYIDNPGNCDGVPCARIKGVNEAQADGGRLVALWRPLADVSVKLSALYQSVQQNGASDVVLPTAGFPQSNGLEGLQQNYIPNTGGFSRSVSVYSADITAKWRGIDFASITAYSKTHTVDSLDFSYAFGPSVAPLYGVDGAAYTLTDTTGKFSQELRLSGSVWQRLDWLLGGFYTRERYVPYGVQTIDPVDPVTGDIKGQDYYQYITPNSYLEYAGFANLTYHFTDQFDVQIGGRQTHGTLSFGQEGYGQFFGPPPYPIVLPTEKGSYGVSTYLFTPEFKLSPHLMLYVRLASGFRPGAPNIVAGVPPMSSADKTRNYEMGAKGEFWDRRLTIDTSVYYIDWKNIQLDSTSGGFSYTANGSAAKSEGLELSATAVPFTGFTASGWIDYDNAVLTEPLPITSTLPGAAGDRLPYVPRFSAHLSLNQDVPLRDGIRWFIGGEFNYVGFREGPFAAGPRTPLPSYTKADLRSGFAGDSWSVNVYVNNVGNARGLIGGGEAYLPPYAYSYITPRTVGLSVSRMF